MENTEKAVYISWFRTKSIHDYPSKIRTYLTEDGVICISQLFLFPKDFKEIDGFTLKYERFDKCIYEKLSVYKLSSFLNIADSIFDPVYTIKELNYIFK